jgi:hypothetical protein
VAQLTDFFCYMTRICDPIIQVGLDERSPTESRMRGLPRKPERSSQRRRSALGSIWLLILPIALLAYLIALPFFGLLWVLEWIVPMPKLDALNDADNEDPAEDIVTPLNGTYKRG